MKSLINLVKYDLLKSKNILLFSFIATVIVEAAFLIGKLADISFLLGLSSVLLVIFLCTSFIAVLIYSIHIFSMDISKKQGYLPFLTPTTSYNIVGAKLITTIIVTLALLAIIVLFGSLDVYLIAKDSEPGISIGYIFTVIGDALEGSWGSVAIMALNYISSWFNNVVCIFLAMALANTLLGESKLRGIVAVGLWVGINAIMSVISLILSAIFGKDMWNASLNAEAMDVADAINLTFNNSFMIIAIALNIVLAVVMYVITCWLVEKKLSI